ncbi:MAG: hypothetical protein R3E50_01700 [Halioglobus sp.]
MLHNQLNFARLHVLSNHGSMAHSLKIMNQPLPGIICIDLFLCLQELWGQVGASTETVLVGSTSAKLAANAGKRWSVWTIRERVWRIARAAADQKSLTGMFGGRRSFVSSHPQRVAICVLCAPGIQTHCIFSAMAGVTVAK